MIDQFTHNHIENLINYKSFQKVKNKNILITGCGGFIGSYLTSALLSKKNKKKFNVYGLDILKPKLDIKKVSIKRFHFLKKDLTNLKHFKSKVKMDIIIHLAGIPSPTYYKKHPFKTYYLNSDLTQIFLEYAKKKKSKFIYFSSSEIYGDPDRKNVPTNENYRGNVNTLGPRACYDESKRLGETLCYIYNTEFFL